MKGRGAAESVHASCVAITGRAVLITGPSGAGKSDLALRLIDRGAVLVSDDYTLVTRVSDGLVASPPSTIAGKIELRGVGIVELAFVRQAPVCLVADLGCPVVRLPDPPGRAAILGVAVPLVAISGLEASAPIKLEQALLSFGLAL